MTALGINQPPSHLYPRLSTVYSDYKCKGPYVANWGCCAASWHPSKLGHQLRAAHYSYFWLLIFKDAINSVEKLLGSEGSVAAALAKVQKHFSRETKHMPAAALNPSKFSDAMRCLTTYEPRADPEAHLADHVIPADNSKWERQILEYFMEKQVIAKAKMQGYKDFKYMLYGNKESGPLSFKITVKKRGAVFVCQPPGVWGRLPDGFKWYVAVVCVRQREHLPLLSLILVLRILKGFGRRTQKST